MRRRIGGIVAACAMLGLLAQPAWAQYQEVPPTLFTGPLSHPRYEDGGVYVALRALYWKQNNPLGNQVVGVRGFTDVDGSISGFPGARLGTRQRALATDDLGPGTYMPGWDLTLGWRFDTGVSVALSWYHLYDARYTAFASTIPPGIRLDPLLTETFLSAEVVNFPPEYAGNAKNVNAGGDGATYGIWNAATSMQISFIQRVDIFDFNARIPIWQTDTWRTYGLMGPRIVGLWERFKWRTLDADLDGNSPNETVADYFNIVSNRLYGVHLGAGYEWFMGSTPIGGWSVSLEAQGAVYFDFVKARARYMRADDVTNASRARNLYSLVPGVEAKVGLWWYPWEAIQVYAGVDLLAFFNTIASPAPVDFNFGSLNPRWDSGQTRYLHGFSFGIGFVF